jgi:hypothetical protein
MPKENTKNFLAEPDNEQWVVEAYKATKNRFADQEMQVGMAGPYTVEIVQQYSLTSPKVEPPRQTGQGETEDTWQRAMLEGAKWVKKTWAEIESDAKNRVRWRILVEAMYFVAEWWDIIYTYIHLSCHGSETWKFADKYDIELTFL